MLKTIDPMHIPAPSEILVVIWNFAALKQVKLWNWVDIMTLLEKHYYYVMAMIKYKKAMQSERKNNINIKWFSRKLHSISYLFLDDILQIIQRILIN